MSAEQNAILLTEGQELDVGLVAGADEFLTQLLGGASAKAGLATLKPVKNSAGVPFVAAIIGGKHVGFLPQGVAADIFPILAGCEEQGMVPRAKARVAAPVDGQTRPLLTVSLAEPDRLMPVLQVVASESPNPAEETTAVAVESPSPVEEAVAAGGAISIGGAELAADAEPGTDAVSVTKAVPATEAPQATGASLEAETLPAAAASVETETSPSALATPAPEFPPQSPPAGAYEETWRVEGDRIISPSPLTLPEGCVTCGDPVVNGRRFNKTLFYCSPWVWLTILVGLLPFIIIYLVVRKPLAISYAQCSTCVGRQNTKKWIAVGVWVVFLAMVAVSIWSQSLIAVIVMIVLFLGALVATVLANPPLRVTGYESGYFFVKGASPRFLANLAGTGDLAVAAMQAPSE
jgi:hypothetical protein